MERPAMPALALAPPAAWRSRRVAGPTKRRTPPGSGAPAPQPRRDPGPTLAVPGSRPDASGFPQALPRAAPEEGRPVSPRYQADRSLPATTPVRSGSGRKIARAPTPPAPHPGPARGARTRPAIRKPARASLAPLLPPDQLNPQAMHPITDSRLDCSEGNLQPVGDLLLSVSAVVGQHDGFTLFRREGHQGAAHRRAFDAAEDLLHHVDAAAFAAIPFCKRLHG